ncbi:hypothetical protein BIV57_20035 [Mangrovactinospora gilvigrisea]|uniref:Uncharacterized protein n=1 Tax=Mangrovactinospora gilvigrisea TaxID=1428644 RepID=A0A1J7C2G5_9ACTN|nr:hypothetical protein BIV57_20035 [Mangrovactinospora gilvigrisea]
MVVGPAAGVGGPRRRSRRGAVVAAVAAAVVVVGGGGAAWAVLGGGGHGKGSAAARHSTAADGAGPSASASDGRRGSFPDGPGHRRGAKHVAGPPSASASVKSTGTAAASKPKPKPTSPASHASASASSSPGLPTPTDAGYVPGSLAVSHGCEAWLDLKTSGTGGYAMGSMRSAGHACEFHYERVYPSNTSSSQNLNSFHTLDSAGSTSTSWYWDGPGYYAGVCVWQQGHYSEYSCGGHYFMSNGTVTKAG